VCKPLTTPITDNVVTDWEVFKLLDKLCPTATGLDLIPAWLLHLAAPVLCKPLSQLFNLSVSTGIIPSPWKQAFIQPVPKVPASTTHADFRPISITTVLTGIFEKITVRRYIYPALLAPPPTITFHDQFAFHPTGSTTYHQSPLLPLFPFFMLSPLSLLPTPMLLSLPWISAKILIPSVTRLSFKSLPSSTSQTTVLIGFRTIYRTTLTVLSTAIIHQICKLFLPV